jgi:hypothetical protein
MEYTEKHNELRNLFNPDLPEIDIPGSGIRIINSDFTSDYLSEGFCNEDDISVRENISFSYPLFVPSDKESNKVILLLHGLNERSWIKYLAWAYYLSHNTGSYVILFPISFHINRSPASWKDPRAMYDEFNERKTAHREINMSSFANIALSNRLTEDPLRFLRSGYQTVSDLVKLLTQIKEGKHPLIPGKSRVNIFAYSIGAFLAQIMVMGNPGNLFSGSRLFTFCGGSVFSNMHGTSKLIMDSLAYERVYKYFMKDFEEDIKVKTPLNEYLHEDNTGIAFRSMIDFGRLRKFREKALSAFSDQTFSIALANDKIIPAEGIVKTMEWSSGRTRGDVEVWDFPYNYSHENPFPVYENSLSKNVDSAFERLFSAAGEFLIA